ncbi:unnamed protein product [Acanthoscelides obtectus]|nr:unnamed protein product [Acanthoscelides obtectus]CAK1672627.1 Vacuolar protein sorting-associated protein 4 [Acanthoscelides obtectus]
MVHFVELVIHKLDYLKSQRSKIGNVDNTSHSAPVVDASSKESEDVQKIIQQTTEIPRVKSMEEIAGLWEVKKVMTSLAILPRSQPQLFVNHKVSKSILLYGPPGTGKTRLVHALASEANAVLHSVSSSNILSAYVGQSERNLKYLFEHMRTTNKFSVLFIDEIDGFCRRRNAAEQDHSRRLKTELMCHLSKMEENPNAMLICATNCPWDLDTAFLRRFHKRLYIPLPGPSERHALLKLFTQQTSLEIVSSSWQFIVEKTAGFSGSDIYNLVQEALSIPILELQDTSVWKHCTDGFYEPATCECIKDSECLTIFSKIKYLPPCSVRARPPNAEDLLMTIHRIKPTVSAEEIKKFEEFNVN